MVQCQILIRIYPHFPGATVHPPCDACGASKTSGSYGEAYGWHWPKSKRSTENEQAPARGRRKPAAEPAAVVEQAALTDAPATDAPATEEQA